MTAVVLLVAAAAAGLLPALAADAQTDVLVVEGDRVGIGTPTPSAPLHVHGTAGDAQLVVEEAGANASRTMFTLRNNGGIRFGMVNQSAGSIWLFSALASFNIDYNGNAGNELQVRQNGDLVIGGRLTENSSQEAKTDFAELDPAGVLTRLAELPIQLWTYRQDRGRARHVGPFAEDFHRLFGVGEPTHLAPGDQVGLALLAIQGLQREIQERDQQIAELTVRLERLERALTVDAARE
jgi:hypothetical protein